MTALYRILIKCLILGNKNSHNKEPEIFNKMKKIVGDHLQDRIIFIIIMKADIILISQWLLKIMLLIKILL